MVSIIIPYKEDRGYLKEAEASIKAQTYTDYEVIKCSSNARVGVNINTGIKLAKGKFICYLCDDDLLTPNSLKDRVEFLESTDFDFIHSRGKYQYPHHQSEYKLINTNVTFDSCLLSNGIMGGSTMYKTEILKKNLFNESLWTAEEWELHLRLLSKGYKLGFLDKVTYLYRVHSEQKSIGNQSSAYQDMRNEVKRTIRSWYLNKK